MPPAIPYSRRFTLRLPSSLLPLKGTDMTSTTATRIDVREIAPRHRHALIFEGFDALKAGEALELVNDHDPAPLRHHFEDRSPGSFDWSYLQAGPEVWRVRIAKVQAVAAPASAGSCCSGGACGG